MSDSKDDPSDGSADTDGDGLSNVDEMIAGTDVSNADSDGDGQSDGAEIASNSDPKDETSNYVDSDKDGLSDAYEKSNGLDSDDPSDGSADTDGDGLSNVDEMIAGTDVSNADSDGDGQSDGAEVASKIDPKDETSNYVDNESVSILDASNSPNVDASAKDNKGSTKPKQISKSSLSFSSGDDIYYFIIGSSYISQSDSKLIQLAKELKSNNLKVTLIGHTDNTGATAFNMRLANLRANKISSFLITQGVDSSQITTKSEGESNPLYPNNNAENKRKNRRVEIVY
jgi:outer membrane protein OmpA-like peptidoglycan-associated protein